MIDISTILYGVKLITENGMRYTLNGVFTSLEWEEQANELAQRATITVANPKVNGAYLHTLAKINCILQITAEWNGGKQLVFEGTIWEWSLASSARGVELTLTAYDRLIRLQQSKDFKYFSAGRTTQSILGAICSDWGLTLDYQWSRSLIHSKTVFSAEAISDMIINTLEEVHRRTGERYVARLNNNKLQIAGFGGNKPVYKFEGNNTESTLIKLTINDLVTRVKIIGREDSSGRAPVDAIVNGDTSYGVLQEIIRRDSNNSIDAAKAEANALIKARGKPEEVLQVNVPDLPFTRKGDAVEIQVGSLAGMFYVEGVSHSGTTRKMTLTISRVPPIPQEANKNSGSLQRGDEVILNGPVFVDSFGNGQGRTFTGYRSTITIVASLERAAPYHIGAVGWARPGDLTKA